MVRRALSPLLLSLLLASCTRKPPDSVAPLVEEFVYQTLAFSPALATSQGYHRHQGVLLDDQLDDFSGPELDRQRRFYLDLRKRLEQINPETLATEDRADFDTMRDLVALTLLELDTIQNWRHNPTVYVELIGNALFSPYVLEYAPKPERYRHIVARLKKVPALLEQAKANLADSPEVWNTVARMENDGNIGMVDKDLREGAPAELRAEYDTAARTALDALRGFNEYLKSDLAGRTRDWRLGKNNYAVKFRYALGTDSTPEQALSDAEAELEAVRRRMLEVARPLHEKMFPAAKDRSDLNRVVSETLGRIAARHSTRENYFSDAGRDLQEARQFVRRKELVGLPPRDNLQVIETPEFMRGIYSVGGFSPAPALEPQLGAFYYLTPIPAGWPKDRIESKLREYNFYGMKLLTIHEAIPGHYLQLEYANDIQPRTRRVLRGAFGNSPYIEGWAVYATEMMLEEGYLENSPELLLTFQKQQLRMIANTILDIRMQTMGMSDQEAMSLMLVKTFQEKEEATGKLQRAKLSSCQLPTYYIGWRDWHRLREHYRHNAGAAYRTAEFHERALKAGAVPLPVLARLLTGRSFGR